MSDAPERIWACVSKNTKSGVVTLLGDATFPVDGWQEYVRADRIEELEVECNKAALWAREQHASADRYAARIEELEAKLAKAQGALHQIAGKKDYADDPWDIARATLAALTGAQKDGN